MTASGASHRASLAAVEHANRAAGTDAYASVWLSANGLHTHAVAAGSGPTTVFVHGFPSFWYCWIRQLEALRAARRVIALDCPGAGATGPAEDYRIDALVGWLAAAIEAAAPGEQVVLVGHDWGAALAYALAQARPELVSSVAGIAAPPYGLFTRLLAHDPQQQQRSAYMHGLRTMTAERAVEVAAPTIVAAYAGLASSGKIDRDETDLFHRACGDPAAFLGGCGWYRANLGGLPDRLDVAEWAPGLTPLGMPAMLIWGEADQTFVADAPDRIRDENPNARVVHLPAIGHWCMLQAAGAVSAEIAALMQPVQTSEQEAVR